MELHQIECFIELSKFQNVSVTAEQLNISQPAVSKTIALLEHELGCKLFDRVGRRIVLNDSGRAFLGYAQEAVKNLSQAREAVKSCDYQPSGIITVGLFSYIGHLADCMDAFIQKFPLAEFNIYSSKSQYTIDNFNALDFSLSSSLNIGAVRDTDESVFLPICSEDYVIVAAPELLTRYGISGKCNHAMTEFQDVPFLIMADNLIFADVTVNFAMQAGFRPKINVRTNDFATKLHLTSLGTAASLIPEICIPEFLAVREDFCILHLTDVHTTRTVYMTTKKGGGLSPIAQEFWKFAQEYYHSK